MATASSPRPTAHGIEPGSSESEDETVAGPDTAPIRVPAGVGTLAGFRTWVTSDEFPRGIRATFLGHEIILDINPEELEPIRVPAGVGTLAEFRTWVISDEFPEGLRATFLGHEMSLDMSPEELETHSTLKVEVSRVLATLIRETGLGKMYGDGARVTHLQAQLSTQPDATFLSWATLEDGKVRLIPRRKAAGQFVEIEGTPDWVMEIVSLYSVRKDTKELREKYHRAGIPEYWLLDARGKDVDFRILVREEGGYVEAPNHDGWQDSRVFGRSFRLERVRDRLGFWEYTLLVR